MSTRKGATRELPARLLPPKPFELERMMAIYYYIYRSSETSYTNQSQLSLAKPEAAAYQPYTQVGDRYCKRAADCMAVDFGEFVLTLIVLEPSSFSH